MDSIPAKLNRFFGRFPKKTFLKYQTIIQPDQPPAGIYFLKKGYVRLFTSSAQGQELTLNLFKPGSFFSMIWALSDETNHFFFESFTPTVTYRAPKEEVLLFLKKEPGIFFDLNRRMLTGINGLLNRIEYLVFGKAKNKLASHLIILAKRFGQEVGSGSFKICLPLSHQDLAHLNGLTRETTSSLMKRLADKKIIDYKQKTVTVLNIEKLKEESLIFDQTRSLPTIL
ncbi:MAG: Crp/Fnr family transcriptional regulator [Candidatus Pacebacteria bacterium]|nr:Crp/Fnr family transcriptional regulator [Candidatus Paceibacterota bacterium]